jgi:hypothetical protein
MSRYPKRSKPSEKTSARGIPKNVIEEMVRKGADFEAFDGEDLCRICVEFGDEAWQVYEQWAETVQDDPGVQAVFAPSGGIQGSVLCPNIALGIPILMEANSIIYHYAHLLAQHFLPLPAAPPAIPGPLNVMPILPIYVHHAKLALSGLIQRIQDPPGNYPTLSGLASGSYICHVQQIRVNCILVTALYKP